MSYYKTRFMFCKLNVRGILYLMVQLPILFDICFECLRHLCLCLCFPFRWTHTNDDLFCLTEIVRSNPIHVRFEVFWIVDREHHYEF